MKYSYLFILLILFMVLLCLVFFIWFDISMFLSLENNPQDDNLNYKKGEINKQKVEKAIQSKVNKKRLDKELNTLESDSNLSKVARYKSRNMKNKNYLGHISPQGNSPLDRVNMYNIDYCKTVGENILKTKYKSPLKTSFSNNTIIIENEDRLSEIIFKGWMNSKDHRNNILNKKWKYQSSGISVNKNGTVYATQVFCS